MRLVAHPVLCNYYVTYRCNARCGFCDIWEKPSPYANLKLVAENLRSLKQLGVKVIDFTGGEPLLHQQIDQLCQMAKEMGLITTLTTNCLLYPKLAHRLQGKVDMLHFSLDSSDPEQHNRSRGVDCFGHVMQSIDLAQTLGEKPDILFTVFENNVDQIPEVYQNIVLPNKLVMILNPVFQYAQVETGKALSSGILISISCFTFTWQ